MKKTYTKPALTYQQQIDLLKSRNLLIDDEARVKRPLTNVSYYRLSAYMVPFRKAASDGTLTDEFCTGTSWDDVYALYKFDRKLRLLVFDAIERIEIALRTQLIYQLSHKYGSHWQNNAAILKPARFNPKTGKTYDVYKDIQHHINEQLTSNQKAQFIKHYLDTYDNPPTPPSWMSVELLYFSELSKICQNLVSRSDRTDISNAFKVKDEKTFCSWLHSINYIRNICAHHARLWNITLDITPSKYYNSSSLIWLSNDEIDKVQSSKLYYLLCVILYLLQTINPRSKFKQHFYDLLDEYKIVNVGYMGFPEGWKEHPLWEI
ncbi:MAG: Abi family protein [Candidatus Cryptobacteroides sp.]